MERLTQSDTFKGRRGPVVLCIMDGVGYGKYPDGDAVRVASTPTLDWLEANCPALKLKAHGTAVGMPNDGDMGNSEVGHNAIGSGRVFDQGAKLVNDAIETNAMYEGETWRELVNNCLANNSALHIIGLLSDGNVHSHIDHLLSMVRRAADEGLQAVRIHTLLDGRDVGATSALDYVDKLEAVLAELNAGGADYCIASGGGRMFITMDRYNADWPMVERGWDTHVRGVGRRFATATEAISAYRDETPGVIDQDLGAFVIERDGAPVGPIVDGDSVIMANFRGDRAMELSIAFEAEEFDRFERGPRLDVTYAGMLQYDAELGIPNKYLVSPPSISRTMGEFLAREGKRQLAISETQKYGHVTYFFNGNRSDKFDDALETYIEIPSDNVSFDQRPWMKGAEITDEVIKALQSGAYDFIRINYPNGDMVGHTGDMLATEISVEAVDLCLQRLLPAIRAAGAVLVVCADHGNADDMFEHDKNTGEILCDEDGRPKAKTCHSLNPVPCIIFDPDFQDDYTATDRTDLGITSLTATCLNLMGYNAPADYDPSVISFG
jgi:2,3-bisphosphoglycerate-independent phosphoglycerate mutase